ncbi:MAG: TauD/TfdA family dioxygenase [Polaromonas sp.]|nr:TauD/TfdA family dioxygenase [Polaromonas sp.]
MDTPFNLDDQAAYKRWRDAKRVSHPRCAQDLVVDVADPRALTDAEQQALLQRCTVANMAIYRSPIRDPDKDIPRQLARQLGLHRLDGNWLADEDGISQIAVAAPMSNRTAFIPYTNRSIKWHTDGYYHPQSRHIRSMILHCVRAAAAGGENALMDHEMAYIAVREANPDWVRALMAPDVMTIPERRDEDGVARAEQAGPVFSVDEFSGALHMRYTARTRSVQWKNDVPTRAAVAFLAQSLEADGPHLFRVRLEPGMGLVCNNVLHDRAGFVDEVQQPRLLYRARYLDRIHSPTLASATAAAFSSSQYQFLAQ